MPRSHQKQHGGKIIGTRWVDVSKGDVETPNCRSRLVGREFNVGRVTPCTQPPLLEALRVVLSHAAAWCDGNMSGRRGVMINDVRRAYFYAKATRDIYIEIPAEDEDAGPDVLGSKARPVLGQVCYPGVALFNSTRALSNSTRVPTWVFGPRRSKKTLHWGCLGPQGGAGDLFLPFSSCRLGHFWPTSDPRQWPFGVNQPICDLGWNRS